MSVLNKVISGAMGLHIVFSKKIKVRHIGKKTNW